jgi:hypothetical protein
MSTIQNPPTEDGNGKPSGASKRSLMSLAIGTLMLITYFPAITTWIPRMAMGGP